MKEYYSIIKRNKISPFAVIWMDLECIMLSEISQTEKYKYCVISHMSNLKKIQQKINKKKIETDS